MSVTTNQGTLPVPSRQSTAYPKAQAVFNICALVVLLLWFNFYPQRIGLWISAVDADSYLPILSPAFFTEYLPWLNLCWVLALGMNIAHLSLGRWTLATRLLDLGLTLLALNVVVSMIFGPAIFAVHPQADSAWATTGQTMVSILSQIAPFVLGVIALALVVDLIKKVVALARSVSP